MPTTTSLQGLASARYAHLLLVDGIRIGFTDDSILTAGTFTGASGHDIQLLLKTDGTEVEEALNFRTGQLDQTTSTFTLLDLDRAGVLPDLFRAIDSAEFPLGLSIFPSDSLAAYPEVHGRFVGTETIGATGARHQFPVISGYTIGDMHVGGDQELPHHRAAPVTRDPIVWRGRRCALYRCYVDLDGTRRPFSEAQRVWWGTITDQGLVNGREWRIDADGPLSWLQKEFGVLTQRDPVPAIGQLVLNTAAGQDETRIGIRLHRGGDAIAGNESYAVRQFTTAITGTIAGDIASDISAELATAAGAAGADGAFDAAQNRWVSIDSAGKIGIHIDDTAAEYGARMELVLHRKVWAALGYAIGDQVDREESDQYYIEFSDYEGGPTLGDPPGSGYVNARIKTWARDGRDPIDNGGNPRYFFPLYSGGTSTLLANLNNGTGQIVDLGDGFGSTIIYHRGQLSRPVASDPADPTAAYPLGSGATRQGLWLFFGKRRRGDVEWDEYQVARASWRNGNLNQQGQVLASEIVVTEWLRPRDFGYDRPKMVDDWVIRTNAEEEYRVQAVPILALDYWAAYERADVVIERMLRSTGTSTGWSSFANDPATILDGGDNDSAGIIRRDAEYVDTGCAVPDEMVGNIFVFGLVYDSLPSDLGRVKVAFSPGTSTAKIFESLTRPFGIAWTLRGGVYGVFDPYTTPSPLDIDFVLTGANKVADGGENRSSSTGQELRALAPIDRFELNYSWAAHIDRHRLKYSTDSTDYGRRYRHGGVIERMDGMGMRNLSGWAERMRQLGDWWNQRHFMIHGYPYMDREPRHVGEFGRITDPRGVNPEGTYGITQMIACVTGVRTPLRPEEGEPHAYLDLLVYANTASTPRLHAMSARGFGIDTDNNRIYTRDNWLGFFGAPWPGDNTFFTEPDLAGIDALGGDLDLTIIQWDGAWRTPIAGVQVTGTGSDGTGDYVQLDGAPSEYFHRMDTIIIASQRGTQAAQWALDYYGVTCAEDGQFGATDGFRWEDL